MYPYIWFTVDIITINEDSMTSRWLFTLIKAVCFQARELLTVIIALIEIWMVNDLSFKLCSNLKISLWDNKQEEAYKWISNDMKRIQLTKYLDINPISYKIIGFPVSNLVIITFISTVLSPIISQALQFIVSLLWMYSIYIKDKY